MFGLNAPTWFGTGQEGDAAKGGDVTDVVGAFERGVPCPTGMRGNANGEGGEEGERPNEGEPLEDIGILGGAGWEEERSIAEVGGEEVDESCSVGGGRLKERTSGAATGAGRGVQTATAAVREWGSVTLWCIRLEWEAALR